MTLTATITVITDIYMFTDIHTIENLKEYFHTKERGKNMNMKKGKTIISPYHRSAEA